VGVAQQHKKDLNPEKSSVFSSGAWIWKSPDPILRIHIYGCFLKWWVSPTDPWVFLLKRIILGCEMGVPAFKETPHIIVKKLSYKVYVFFGRIQTVSSCERRLIWLMEEILHFLIW